MPSERNQATQMGAEANTAGQKHEAEGVSQETYTLDEVQALLQKEGDRRVSEALKKSDQKWEKKMKDAQAEAERLAKLSQEEREQEAARAAREAFEAERAAFEHERLTYQTGRLLRDEGLPDDFADILTGADAETTKKNVDAFKERFNTALEEKVKEKLAGNSPQAATGAARMSRIGRLSVKAGSLFYLSF